MVLASPTKILNPSLNQTPFEVRNRGGKGVGRLGWLKVFSKIEIDSTYFSSGGLLHRSFDFVLAPSEQVRLREPNAFKQTSIGTRVALADFDTLYGSKCPTRWKTIVDHLVGHFLPILVTDNSPRLHYVDGDQNIDLKAYFTEQVVSQSDSVVEVELPDGEKIGLNLRHIKARKEIRGPDGGYHRLFLTANDRAVEEFPLDEQLGLKTLDGEAVYLGCVSGEYFNQHVNQERTRFTFNTGESFAIRRALAKAVRDYLNEYVERVYQEKERVAIDVISENPQFLYLQGKFANLYPPNLHLTRQNVKTFS